MIDFKNLLKLGEKKFKIEKNNFYKLINKSFNKTIVLKLKIFKLLKIKDKINNNNKKLLTLHKIFS